MMIRHHKRIWLVRTVLGFLVSACLYFGFVEWTPSVKFRGPFNKIPIVGSDQNAKISQNTERINLDEFNRLLKTNSFKAAIEKLKIDSSNQFFIIQQLMVQGNNRRDPDAVSELLRTLSEYVQESSIDRDPINTAVYGSLLNFDTELIRQILETGKTGIYHEELLGIYSKSVGLDGKSVSLIAPFLSGKSVKYSEEFLKKYLDGISANYPDKACSELGNPVFLNADSDVAESLLRNLAKIEPLKYIATIDAIADPGQRYGFREIYTEAWFRSNPQSLEKYRSEIIDPVINDEYAFAMLQYYRKHQNASLAIIEAQKLITPVYKSYVEKMKLR